MLAASKPLTSLRTVVTDGPFTVQRTPSCWCLSGGDGSIRRGQWHDFLHRVRVESGSLVRILARTGDMAPNALQRAQLYQLASECELWVAWLSDSEYAHGAIRALRGGGHLQIEAFDVDRVSEAARFLGLDPEQEALAARCVLGQAAGAAR